MSAESKPRLVETEDTFICVPGDTPDLKLHIDAKTPSPKRRCLRSNVGPSGYSSSSSSDRDQLRSEENISGDANVEIRPTFPPPIELSLNHNKRAVVACGFADLRKKMYFLDHTDLISAIISVEERATYFCFPRSGSKSTVVSKLIHWLLYDDGTRAERLESFRDTKIFNLASPNGNGNVEDGVIGFNQYIIVNADFGSIDVDDLVFEDIQSQVVEEFCQFLRSRYSFSEESITKIKSIKASTSGFFSEIIRCVKSMLPDTSPTVKRPTLLIIDNFDAPSLRILNKTKSIEFALKVMSFFNMMLSDVSRLDNFLFDKIILFGTHQPIGMNSKSNLVKIIIESYPYGREEICTKFFFSEDDVKSLLKKYNEDESTINNLSTICGQYNIRGRQYFHIGSVVNYVVRSKENIENPIYWSSVNSLDILADLSFMLPYEMVLWTYEADQELIFTYQEVLKYDNLLRQHADTAYTYLLEAGYLTQIKDTNPPTYKIANSEAHNLFTTRYKEWCDRIPRTSYEPLQLFATGDYKRFFEIANNILKTSYAGEDFQYEGQYHVFLSSFFHNVPEWHFKSNNQAGYGRYDFVTWSKSSLVDTGYVFEIAILKPENNPKKKISDKILEKKKQVEDREYFLEVRKENIKCIIVVGCRKMLSYSVFDVKKPVSTNVV